MLTPEQKAAKRAKRASDAKKIRNSILTVIILFTLVPLVGPYMWGPIGVNIHYSEGERKIKLVKVTQKGLFWKTWEMEGIVAAGPGIATTYVWDFSVDNDDPHKDELLSQLNDAFEGGRTIRVVYDQRAGHVPWRSDTSYFVRKVIVE